MCKGRIAPPHTPATVSGREPSTLTAVWFCQQVIEILRLPSGENGHFLSPILGDNYFPSQLPQPLKI